MGRIVPLDPTKNTAGASLDDMDHWPTPVTTVVATALARVLELLDGVTVDTLSSTLSEIRATADKALAFDPERMRLRFDDMDGNRSFLQQVDGLWTAYRHDGAKVFFEYCFGRPCNPAQIVIDLCAATTIHEIERAASRHIRGLQNVQVEATWERHRHDGGHLGNIPA